jgi:hypothetical protein
MVEVRVRSESLNYPLHAPQVDVRADIPKRRAVPTVEVRGPFQSAADRCSFLMNCQRNAPKSREINGSAGAVGRHDTL